MKTLDYNNYTYNITNNYNIMGLFTLNDFEVCETSKTIIKEKFTFIPHFFKGKYIWLKKVKFRYRLYFIREQKFDDGWTYQNYWTKWKPEWEIIDIIN